MKNRLRQPTRTIALLLLGLMAVMGCQKTELDNTPAQQENFQRFRIEHYTAEDLQRNGKMETELGKLLKLLAKGGQVHAKDGTSPVGTDSIKYVEEYATGKHSYNFPMPADSLGRMRNLAMVSRNGSGYDAHVVVYGFSEEEFPQLDEVELSERGVMFSPVLDLDSLSQDPSGLEKVHAGWMCVEVWGVETLTEHNGDLHGVSHDGTCTVPGCRFGQTVPVLVSSDCTLDTGGGTSDGGSWHPNPNGGQGNPHPGPGNGNVTTPASCNGCSYFDPENPGEQCLALTQVAQLVSALGLNSGQAAMIRSNCALGSRLYDYWSNGGETVLILEFLDILEEIPEAKFDRYLELLDIIANNPWALIEDCAQENGLDIANYQYLYDHTLPQSCVNRLNALPDGFQNQPLDTGNAAVANVDYYGVEITTRPDINGDGVPDSNEEIFNAYKNNFHYLASGSQDNFQFSCNAPWITGIGNTAHVGWDFQPYDLDDYAQWLYGNPLAVIFYIDAWADGFPYAYMADDGAIMISEYTPNYWIGSTIQTPNTGTQPFSGNRQWGWLTNQNGNLELYARAVDVARVDDFINIMPTSSDSPDDCQEDTYYNIGEATWSNLQEEIKQFILDNGGQATVVPKTAIRFDKTKLKEVLESNESIDQIPCN